MHRIIKEHFPTGQFFVTIPEDELEKRLKAGTARAIPSMPLAYEAVKPKRKRRATRKPKGEDDDILGGSYATRDMKASK